MASQPRPIVYSSLLLCSLLLSAPAFADEPRRTRDVKTTKVDPERAREEKMAADLRRARELDRIREAKREQEREKRRRELEEASTVALAPPRETAENKRARAMREAEARREVRAADRERNRYRAAARRAGRDPL